MGAEVGAAATVPMMPAAIAAADTESSLRFNDKPFAGKPLEFDRARVSLSNVLPYERVRLLHFTTGNGRVDLRIGNRHLDALHGN